MTEDRFRCGGLMERDDLCLVEVMGYGAEPEQACGILGKFGAAGVSLNYLSLGHCAGGGKNMSFCVSREELEGCRHLLDEIRDEFAPRMVDLRESVMILTLYGPHFLEKHSLAAEVFAALCGDGIDAFTVCSSINSISVVIRSAERERAVGCLRQRFEWPE